jgi:hypothetical protein
MDRRVKPGGDDKERMRRMRESNKMETNIMPSWREKPEKPQNFLKRRTFKEGKRQVDDAHYATHRLYCEALGFWRGCKMRQCQRHRRCMGEASICLARNLPSVPRWRLFEAQKEVIAGGPRRISPATHIEWTVRRSELAKLIAWGFG